MIREVVIPVMDQTTEAVLLADWLVAEGDRVVKGEALCEVETDKATGEIEAPVGGIVRKLLIEPGTEIPPLTVIALVGNSDDPLPEIDPFYRTQQAQAVTKVAKPVSDSAKANKQAAARPQKIRVSPRAKRMAAELGVDLANIEGSGPYGRILEDDVRQAAQQPAARAQQAQAARVSHSWQTIPHFYTAITVDMSRIVAAHEKADRQTTYTDYMALALAQTLGRHPTMNGHWRQEGLVIAPAIHLGLVVATGSGLVIPVLKDVQTMPLAGITEVRSRLVSQARAGRLSASTLMEPTFTLSNVGPGHIDRFTAIINPPQVAILSVGSILPRPLAINQDLMIRPTAVFTLGVDHRAIDGRQAAAFLEELKIKLEAN